jgi:hypothetical protein
MVRPWEVSVMEERLSTRVSIALGVIVALLAGMLAVAVSVVTAPPAAATHDRAAQLTWHLDTGRTVEFHFDGAFRRSYFATFASGGSGAGPYPMPGPNVGDTVTILASGSNLLSFGDGSFLNTIVAEVGSVDAANDTITVHAHIAHTYPGTSTEFIAAFENCCRLSPPQHINNPDRGMRTETRVSLQPDVTASPESEVSPIVDCPVNALCQFFLPATDADNGTLSWAFASSAQAAGSAGPFVQPVGATIDPATGLYQWDTTGQSVNPSGNSYFSTQVIITETAPSGGTATVAVDFFLRVTSTASPNQPPVFSGATPADGTLIEVPVNAPVGFTTEATDPDAGAVVTLGMLNKPASATYATVAGDPASGTFSWTPTTVGDTIVTLTAQDQFGLQATQRSLTIRVGDDVPPVVSVPADMTVEATGPSGATVGYVASAMDNVDGAITPTCAPASGSTFPLGTTPVTCTATDAAGNTGSASFDVAVVDTTGPAISGLSNLTVEAQDSSGATVTFAPTATDLVDGPRPVSCSPPSGSTFSIGTDSVSCTSQDATGNTTFGTFDVIVEDTTDPVLTLPADITAEATGPGGAPVSYTASAADSVDGSITPVCAPPSGSTFPLGNTIVSCTATDAAGNDTTGTFTVSVVDTTPPVLTVPDDMTVEADGPSGTVVTYSASAVDLVDGSVPALCDVPSGSTFPLGSTLVTCTATDDEANTSSASFTVTVADDTPPHVAVPPDPTVEATGPSGAIVTYTASASDVVDGTVPVTCAPASGSTFAVGDTAVTCSATDAEGNTGSASFTVHVVDTTAPVLTGDGVTAEATGPSGAPVSFTVTATDVVDGAVPVTCTPPSGSTFPLGTTMVACEATDAHGNTGTTTLPVTVEDTTAPALTLPANMTVAATSGSGATVSYSASASDVVDGAVPVSCAPPSGSTFPIGTTTVTCSATDAAENTSSGSFTVTVERVATTTTITSSANPSTFGQSVTLTAIVTSGSGTPTGSVLFSDGGAPMALVPLDPAGTASITTSSLAVGNHSITAEYLGEGKFASSSAGLVQVVTRAPVVLVANPSILTLLPGLRLHLTLSATLRTTAGAPLAGRVITFSVGGQTVCTATTNASGYASCGGLIPGTLLSILGLGYTASFGGDGSYLPGSARGNLITVLGLRL